MSRRSRGGKMRATLSRQSLTTVIALFSLPLAATGADHSPRQVIPLDGTWQIAEGRLDVAPSSYARTVPVPGLTTLASPAFAPAPGPIATDRHKPPAVDPSREAFWYRRTFRLDRTPPAVARLKVAKAMFGSRVILNGRVLGDNPCSVTPGWFEASDALRPGENELLIRVGSARGVTPKGAPLLLDPEKQRYIPGIFDSVELILSGTPHFLHVQTAPDLAASCLRVQAVLRNAGAATRGAVSFVVREALSGREVRRVTNVAVNFAGGEEATVDVRIPLPGCRLWSPEDPFLYRLEADSGTDRFTTRFGMREFKFDAVTRRAVLNGKPYFMRGTNFTVYRFFEDPQCGDLPWRAEWVRRLHERVKGMEWNCIRYCIGFPPEAWYDIADELGLLIQDEFPFFVRDAFTPVGLMVDYWAGQALRDTAAQIPVLLVNDLDRPWNAAVTFRLRPRDGGPALFETTRDCRLEPMGTGRLDFTFQWPARPGAVVAEAELTGVGGRLVRSVRDIRVVGPEQLGLAWGRPAVASSSAGAEHAPACAVDGDPTTQWTSEPVDPSWLVVDLGAVRRIARIQIQWGREYPGAFTVQVSRDGQIWTEVLLPSGREPESVSNIHCEPCEARHVRVTGTDRRVQREGRQLRERRNYAIRELQVFE